MCSRFPEHIPAMYVQCIGTRYKRPSKQLHAHRSGDKTKRKNNIRQGVKKAKQGDEMNQRTTAALDFALITFISIWSSGLQAPIESNVTTQTNETYHVIPITSCPGYKQGNPSERNRTECDTGTSLEAIDFEKAFGFNSGENPDWNACGLPRLPEEK